MSIESNLHRIAQAIDEDRRMDASRLIDETAQAMMLPKDLSVSIFVNALARRIQRDLAAVNLYLRELNCLRSLCLIYLLRIIRW